jgi:hypothetical protein
METPETEWHAKHAKDTRHWKAQGSPVARYQERPHVPAELNALVRQTLEPSRLLDHVQPEFGLPAIS